MVLQPKQETVRRRDWPTVDGFGHRHRAHMNRGRCSYFSNLKSIADTKCCIVTNKSVSCVP